MILVDASGYAAEVGGAVFDVILSHEALSQQTFQQSSDLCFVSPFAWWYERTDVSPYARTREYSVDLWIER